MKSGFGDTIFALSSGSPPAGVAVIRLSGTSTRAALSAVAGELPPARTASLRRIRDSNGETLDRGLVLFFSAPHSFTGEDCGELHVHGGPAVVTAILAALATQPGLRAAEAGEFTRRAFAAGKLDLTEAEALSDLLEAQTEGQRRFAIANGNGRNAVLYTSWRQRLLHARAHVEALLDFSEEEDVSGALPMEVLDDLASLCDEIQQHAASYRQAEIIRSGFQVVILGAPNAGKSSLLNALAARDVAIVTEEAGTTRDVVQVELDIDGAKVVVADTAGIRDTTGKVERIGIERALDAATQADLVLHLEDVTAPGGLGHVAGGASLRIANKIDLLPAGTSDKGPLAGYDLQVSAARGDGIPQLLSQLGCLAKEAAPAAGPMPFRERHLAILARCAASIAGAVAQEADLELRAEELRVAADELARITGAIETEEMLGVIFSSFCIGK